MNVEPPQYTDGIDVRYFIEAYTGPTNPVSLLTRFPDALYSKSPDSHFISFMYALLGPTGVGWLRLALLEARLTTEYSGTQTSQLEAAYGNPFSLVRSIEESYLIDDLSGLLPAAQWARIQAQDEAYRTRAIWYLNATRLGGTPDGMALAASSGLGANCEVVENYKYLFDTHSDDPLGIPYYGQTFSLNEFIVIPNVAVSRSTQQFIQYSGTDHNEWTISYNGYTAGPFAYTDTAPIIQSALWTLPSLGPYVEVTGGPLVNGFTITFTGLLANSKVFPFTAEFVAPSTTTTGTNTAGSLTLNVVSTANMAAGYSLTTDTGSITDVSTIKAVQSSTQILLVSPLNFTHSAGVAVVTNGPNTPITVQVTSGGLDPSLDYANVSDQEKQAMQVALDYLRPVNSVPTYRPNFSTLRYQLWSTVAATSEFPQAIRFVTGSSGVQWPTVDSTHWIEPAIELEAPQTEGFAVANYVGFHNVSTITSYTDAALTSSALTPYSSLPFTGVNNLSTLLAQFPSVHVGTFPEMAPVMPYFNQFKNTGFVWNANLALADYAESLTVSTQGIDGTAFINNIYPADYITLQGVPTFAYSTDTFWSSLPRQGGADILEIDLGSPQAVNFISMEVTKKPVDIQVNYDVVDQYPVRMFQPVVVQQGPLDNTYLLFEGAQNPWQYMEWYFNDGEEMIFTRFIQLIFTRRNNGPTSFLFDRTSQTQVPWSIDVRNLRIGRNVPPQVN